MKVENLSAIDQLLPANYIARTFHKAFFEHVKGKEEVSILYGPRQVGKSVEIYRCIHELLKADGAPPDIYYFNLDKITDDFEDPEAFLNLILARRKNYEEPTYVFIDEAQRLDDIGLFVKYIYDKKQNVKFILTGSASLDIKRKIKEPLTGRKREFMLSPLSLMEVVSYKGIDPRKLHGSFGELKNILRDYLTFGGYPGVQVLSVEEDKRLKLEEIADSYVNRDIRNLYRIENTAKAMLVLSILGESIGSLISVDNISNLSGVNRHTLLSLMEMFEKTFVVYQIKPFYKNKAKELIHHPKIYFYDLGLRNAILGKLDKNYLPHEKGKLFENMCAGELRALYGLKHLKFWRNLNRTEVDFVVDQDVDALRVYEAKFQWKKEKAAKNLQSFLSQYGTQVADSRVIHEENFWELWGL